jgi:hypothetical protein
MGDIPSISHSLPVARLSLESPECTQSNCVDILLFMGGVYAHSETAITILAVMRLARLKGGGRVEVYMGIEGNAKET